MEDLSGNYVVKFDGLMGGKGVKVSGEHLADINEGLKYCKNIINNSGTFVIEEKLVGEEFSLMSFCDGQNLAHMPAIQDHKRAYEGDIGPNTGGMGCYSDSNHSLPFLKEQEVFEATKRKKENLTQYADPAKGDRNISHLDAIQIDINDLNVFLCDSYDNNNSDNLLFCSLMVCI